MLSIPLSTRFPPDSVYWVYEKSGEYYMKAAYRAIFHDDAHRGVASSSSAQDLWNKIWNSDLLPRVKLFARRACHNALPTNNGLHHRVSSMSLGVACVEPKWRT